MFKVMRSSVLQVSIACFSRPEQKLTWVQGVIETIYKIHHDLGVLSNTIVCATYERPDHMPLTPATMYKALLATILIDQPSTKKMARTRTWQARLERICFKDCVRFIDDMAEKEQFIRLIQVEHNT